MLASIKKVKRICSLALIFILLFPAAVSAKTDGYIYSDPVTNTYTGRRESAALINNLRFTDLPGDSVTQDAVVRSGVLNLIKAYNGPQYSPDTSVTKEEAVAMALRAAGLEEEAQAAGVAMVNTLPADTALQDVWAVGYLTLARNMRLITNAQYADALSADPSALDPEVNFIRTAPATREEFADWLVRALQYVNPEMFTSSAPQQSIYGYSDWRSIAPDKVNAVEHLTRERIMQSAGSFRPKAAITRLDAARALRNMDGIYYTLVGLQKKTGTVAGLSDEQYNETAVGKLWRHVYVRSADGLVDLLQYSLTSSSTPQDGTQDAVTLRGGNVAGLVTLAEGDQIEYLVEPATGAVWYVQVTGGLTESTVQGRLQLFNFNEGTVTFTDDSNKPYTFPMADGLYGTDTDGTPYVLFNNIRRSAASLPLGSAFRVTLVNNTVTRLEYVGEPLLKPEMRGIVIDNNPGLGYLTIIDANGREFTSRYSPEGLRVQKTEHYDMRDTIGSINTLFPDFNYNPRETDISAIEPGDIVSYRVDDEGRITGISASVSYTTRYGRVREFRNNGGLSEMLLQFENGGTAWFSAADGVMVRKAGRPVNANAIVPGDWVRLLVNQAVIGPGYMMESVKEISVEGDAHYISNIIKGRLAGLHIIQNKLNVQDAQRLTDAGWANYNQIAQFSIAGKNIEYYYDGKPVTLSYVNNYLNRADANVYLALENNYAGETVRTVSIRSGRDELLRADTVLYAGDSGFGILGTESAIATDAGTIVRKNGRLVDGSQITAPDYAMVSLNGYNTAAVVDITPTPASAGVMIARGRVYSVDEGRSFKVESMALFGGQDWSYTPIQREFSIDHGTLFMDDSGLTSIDEFLDYTDDSVINKVYNIVIEGSRAARVIDAPYATQSVRGTIYAIDGDTIQLKDMYVRDAQTGRWSLISNRNATGSLTIPDNAIVIDRNQVVGANTLRVGQQLKIMTDALPETIASGMQVTGYIVTVER